MQARLNCFVKVLIFLAIACCCAAASMEDESRNMIMPNNLYGRTLDNDLLLKLLLMPQRMCHPKRNSDIINSLLGLPKNMNNAGK